MKSAKKYLLILHFLLSLILVSGCASQAPTAVAGVSAAAGTPAAASVKLEPCQLSSPGTSYSVSAQCGKLSVFEDQNQKTGRKIDIGFAVIKAVSKSPEADPLFMLAGGPGQAATESFPMLVPVLSRLQQKRDLVLIDQRGTGLSNPLRCPTLDDTLDTGEEISTEDRASYLKDCQEKLSADTTQYTTQAFLADLDQVRAALGYEQVNLLGISYGTRVALAYQREFPQHVRTVTLDSVAAPDWELGPENPANAQHALDLVFERCAADTDCQKAFPNVKQGFSKLLADLNNKPVELTIPHPTTGEMTKVKLTGSAVATTIQIFLYAPETAAMIPLLIHTTAERGDYSLLAAQYLIANNSLGASIYDGLYLSVLCAEDAPFYPAKPERVASYLPDHSADLVKQCAAWPHAQVDASYKQPVTSDIPTLLLSGEADPVTPPANAEKAARTLSNSLNLVVPGIGHNVIFRGCVPKILTSFVETGSVKGLDTACVQEVRPAPFMLNFSGSRP